MQSGVEQSAVLYIYVIWYMIRSAVKYGEAQWYKVHSAVLLIYSYAIWHMIYCPMDVR